MSWNKRKIPFFLSSVLSLWNPTEEAVPCHHVLKPELLISSYLLARDAVLNKHILCIRETRVYCCSGSGIREIISSRRDLLLSVTKDCVLSHSPLSSPSCSFLISAWNTRSIKRWTNLSGRIAVIHLMSNLRIQSKLYDAEVRAVLWVNIFKTWPRIDIRQNTDLTRTGLSIRGSIPSRGIRFLSSKCPDWLWRHTAPINLSKPSGFITYHQV